MRAEVLRQAVAILLDIPVSNVLCRFGKQGGRQYQIHISSGNTLSLADSTDSWIDAFAVVVEQAHFQWRASYLKKPPRDIEKQVAAWKREDGEALKDLIHRGRMRVKECWDLGIEPGRSPTKYLETKERQRRAYHAKVQEHLAKGGRQTWEATQTAEERYAYYARTMYEVDEQPPIPVIESYTGEPRPEPPKETKAEKEARIEELRVKLEKKAQEERERKEREERLRRRREYEDAYARAPSEEFVICSGEAQLHVKRLLGKARLRGLMGFDGNGNRRIPRAQRLDEYDGDSERWG